MANKKNGPRQDELSAEDYAILGAAFSALGDFFALLSLIKQREASQTGGAGTTGTEIVPGIGSGLIAGGVTPRMNGRRR
ncbi:hypothetical protein KIH86_11995 [Paenibacillus sp. HN-1]|uniref:hypothetical protein n=1 Tax=Paenibacillus TaxID=44249 RepID=UPI001CAA399C|nr:MULTISPECIES: hypothetical protein [Paenibacillus]MBY9081424.1 hypothetical protein [Paenibacillus sp. CGMCC 1.18879]MBY9084944.1 hypothetical protein [Paenibacillus sinensis]